MNLPCEFEQTVKYVMSVWPGSRPETKSETILLSGIHKEDNPVETAVYKAPFEYPQPMFSPHHIFYFSELKW